MKSSDFTYDPAKNTLTVSVEDGQPIDYVEGLKSFHRQNLKAWVASQDAKSAIAPKEYDYKFNKQDPKNAEGGEWKVWQGKDDAEKTKLSAAIAVAHFTGKEPESADARAILKLRGEDPKAVNCSQCHPNFGREAKFRWDEWGTLARPNNFEKGVFRGGRRPVDLYYRVHSGINGSGMNNFGKTISSNSIWDLVNLVHNLSYPGMRSKMGVELD
jgi:mono/diheme cytochrome c family protein